MPQWALNKPIPLPNLHLYQILFQCRQCETEPGTFIMLVPPPPTTVTLAEVVVASGSQSASTQVDLLPPTPDVSAASSVSDAYQHVSPSIVDTSAIAEVPMGALHQVASAVTCDGRCGTRRPKMPMSSTSRWPQAITTIPEVPSQEYMARHHISPGPSGIQSSIPFWDASGTLM